MINSQSSIKILSIINSQLSMNSDKILKRVLFASSLVIVLIAAAMVFSLFEIAAVDVQVWMAVSDFRPVEPYAGVRTMAHCSLSSARCSRRSWLWSSPFHWHSARLSSWQNTSAVPNLLPSSARWSTFGWHPIHHLRSLGILYPLSAGLSNWDGVRKGFGVFTSALILAIMIVPYATSLSNTR